MSSRKGEIIRALDWVDDCAEKISEKMQGRDIENKEEIIKKISISAIKYSILKNSVGKDIVYDEKKSLDFSGNSGPYLQYAYVRAFSLLKNIKNIEKEVGKKQGDISYLEKILCRFEEKVLDAMENYSPHHIANYLYDISSGFNAFYANTKILDEENKDYKYNICVVKKFADTMKKGLDILGIETVEKM